MWSTRVLICSFFVLVIASCGPTGEDVQNDLSVVSVPPTSIAIPKNWIKVDNTQTMLAYSSTNFTEGFANNINVIVVPQVSPALATFVTNNKNSLSKELYDYALLAETNLTIGQDPAVKIIFTGRQNPVTKIRKFVQIYVIHQNKGYVLTLTLNENEDPLKYETIMASWKF